MNKKIYNLLIILSLITFVSKVVTLIYREDKYGFNNFNENELKSDECFKEGNVWSKDTFICSEPEEIREVVEV